MKEPALRPEQREFLRLAILRVLNSNPTGKLFGLTSIAMLCNQFGFDPRTDELSAELHYLEGKRFVRILDKKLSPEVHAWQITAEGMDFVAQQTAD